MSGKVISGLEAKTISTKQKWDLLSPYLKEYGSNCMAYSTLQPGMEYFLIDGLGYAGFRKFMGTKFILGEPICDPKNRSLFLKNMLVDGGDNCFVQVKEDFARLLHNRRGFYATPMGIETSLDLTNFEDKWRKFNWVGRKIRRGEKRMNVYESSDRLEVLSEDIERISKEWLNNGKRGGKELSFLARPYQNNSPMTRTFYSFEGDSIKGVTVFDPVFSGGDIKAYSVNITRTSKDAPDFTGDYSWYQAAKKLKKDGCNRLELGLSPLSDLDKDQLEMGDRSTKWLLKTLSRVGKKMYNFNGVSSHKKNFNGNEVPVYFAHKTSRALPQILKLLRLSGVV